MNNVLRYDAPATDWINGLPIGTGRLAAMVMGTTRIERIALNHEKLWKGVNRERDNEPVADQLDHIRELLFAGKYAEGGKAANDAFGGEGGVSEIKGRVDPYQPAGDLYVEFSHGSRLSYERRLELDTALASVEHDGFKRHYLGHLPDDLIVAHYEAEDTFSCSIWLDRTFDSSCTVTHAVDNKTLILAGDIQDGIDFRVEARVWHRGGKMILTPDRKMHLQDVDEVIISINIGTSVDMLAVDECSQKYISSHDWTTIFDTNLAEYQKHYGAFKLDLPLDDAGLMTDKRIDSLRQGADDPGMVLLYFNYGRYLLCASSATAELPTNLQGKWCEDLEPPWDSDYHNDINLQMNYWIAEPTGMQDYAEALLQHIERFVPHGKKAAMDLYGCKGVLLPLQTDAWGRSTPESYGWAVWIGAAAWLAQHMWWHYEYSLDKDYLEKRAYPYLKEVAAFYESYLVLDDDGVFQVVPSQSPENKFKGSGDLPVGICVSATMDLELIWEVLTHTIQAAELLGSDDDKCQEWQHILDHLPPLQIGSKGQLLEWNEEFEEVEPGHRHISHLYAFYPG